MIDYEAPEKTYPCERYCKKLERLFAENGLSCEGYCSFFGYDVKVETTINNQKISWQFLRHQTTQRGFLIPRNARDYAECTIIVHGLRSEYSFSLKQPFFAFRGNFSVPKTTHSVFRLRGKIPDAAEEAIRQFLCETDVLKLIVRKDVLTCTVFDEPEQPLLIAKKLQQLIPD